jgi:transcriptional regulator with XRE-family HTH domain
MRTVISEEEALANAAANLARMMDDRGWTQLELAGRADVGQSTLSRLLRGIGMPGVAAMARIAEALDSSVERILAQPAKEKSRQPA